MDTSGNEGERYLTMIGFGQYAETEIETKKHGKILARDFLTICGGHAITSLMGYEKWVKDNDPRAAIGRAHLRAAVGKNYLNLSDDQIRE